MKVLLIHPPWLRFFGSCLAAPPIALNYIASSVRKNLPEISIEVYNADYAQGLVPSMANDLFTSGHATYRRRLFDLEDPIWNDIKNVISAAKPEVIGISSMTATFPAACQLTKVARQICPGAKIVLGGRHPSALPELSLQQSGADYVVIGDGEETFCELLQNLERPQNVAGIAFKRHEKMVCQTGQRQKQQNIDDFPLPLFESKLSHYGFEDGKAGDIFTWSLLTARGCPFQCVYCATDHQVRFRSIENVMGEIRTVKERYGISHFCFEDDTFSLKRDRMEQMCHALAAEKVKWTCVTRVDTLDENLVRLMKESGCTQVYIGIETGSPKTLKAIRKKLEISQVENALTLFKKFDLMVMGFFIIGFPWETAADMQKTIDLIRRLPLNSFQLNIATPLPGTTLFNDLVAAGKLNPDTIDWSELHQGSLHMNFSAIPQPAWERMLMHFQRQALRILKKRFFKVMLKRFINEPFTIFRKVASRLAANPRLLAWFIAGRQGNSHD
ncbi:MAG TPA: radical SAM protein [Candidatus Rifleibacterium sp.]|nr:radical SAM protein [Candidatus Rifleibacterium sp.]HPT48267.1 radical SAM protein [Candidatus Rifleibacterium sp.]